MSAIDDGWDWDDEGCEHDCDDYCEPCTHEHCFACGGCECPGYCDDYQTYNFRPSETGGPADQAGDAVTAGAKE